MPGKIASKSSQDEGQGEASVKCTFKFDESTLLQLPRRQTQFGVLEWPLQGDTGARDVSGGSVPSAQGQCRQHSVHPAEEPGPHSTLPPAVKGP